MQTIDIQVYAPDFKARVVTVPARKVEIVEWLETYVHRSHKYFEGMKTATHWIVSEKTTGLSICSAQRTQKEVIATALDTLTNIGKEKVLAQVALKLKENNQ